MFESTVVCGHVALGIQGEHHARKVSFSETAIWRERFGEGTFELLHQRNGDVAPYPIVMTMENDVPYWYVTNADTAIAGAGKCELRYVVNNVLIKSCTFVTDVIPSLVDASGEVPEPEQAWVDQVLNAAEEVKDAVTHNPIIGDNGNWLVWDADKGEYIDTGVKASGSTDIEVPTKLSQLDNDSGFITADDIPSVDVPEKVSELENDVGFVKGNDLPFTHEDYSFNLSTDFVNLDAYDSMNLSARNSLGLSSENDINISASTVYVNGDIRVQAPTNDNSAVNKKYVDDAIADSGGGGSSDGVITTDDMSVSLDGKDFLNISSYDSMSLSTRNALNLESENEINITATNVNVSGDMQVQTPTNDNSAVNKKYVDDAVRNAIASLPIYNGEVEEV